MTASRGSRALLLLTGLDGRCLHCFIRLNPVDSDCSTEQALERRRDRLTEEEIPAFAGRANSRREPVAFASSLICGRSFCNLSSASRFSGSDGEDFLQQRFRQFPVSLPGIEIGQCQGLEISCPGKPDSLHRPFHFPAPGRIGFLSAACPRGLQWLPGIPDSGTCRCGRPDRPHHRGPCSRLSSDRMLKTGDHRMTSSAIPRRTSSAGSISPFRYQPMPRIILASMSSG